jgi:hypothetical protein
LNVRVVVVLVVEPSPLARLATCPLVKGARLEGGVRSSTWLLTSMMWNPMSLVLVVLVPLVQPGVLVAIPPSKIRTPVERREGR